MKPTERITYSPAEAAEVLGLSRAYFYRAVLPGLPSIYTGRRRLIPRTALVAWAERNTVQPMKVGRS